MGSYPRDENGLTKKMKKFIEYAIAYPAYPDCKIAEIIGCSQEITSKWKHDPYFKAAMDKALKEHWEGLRRTAQNTMAVLVESGDYKATAYVLDSLGYGGTKKVEAKVSSDNVININIVSEDAE